MVSLTMMARLLEAVRPEARLILVGDPDQLASVEAGAVLADLVDGLSGRDDMRVAALTTPHRFGESIGRWPRRSGSATPTGRSSCCGPATSTSSGVEADDAADRAARSACCRMRLRVREAAVLGDAAGAGDARRAPAAVCAPRGPVRGAALERSGRAVADRGDGRGDVVAVVRRAAVVGDGQRLRAWAVQRRHRRGGGRATADCGRHRRSGDPVDVRDRAGWPTSRRCMR